MKYGASMIVLTYNQEAYVRHAVEAALAQTGKPIEILVSDDCSTDLTFTVIKEVVKGYNGPHKVVVNRNDVNIGLIAHINQSVLRTEGEIIIPAYGDDVSFPERATCIQAAFSKDSPQLVHSYAVPIDESGQERISEYRNADLFKTQDPLLLAPSLFHYLGASGGWSRELFRKYGPLNRAQVFDDHILGFRAALEGRISLIDKPLLYYREGVGLSHLNFKDRRLNAIRARRMKTLMISQAVYADRLDDARVYGLLEEDPIILLLKKRHFISRARLSFHTNKYDVFPLALKNPKLTLKAYASEFFHLLKRR
ncbi:glycosyltransferase [Sulfitobacter sp. MF3-043]|uniref:glycosyltransferase n=1 Tax=Sulfitobacter sediminivivens TaxID=3252902 RepID=UPI0036D9AA11